MNWIVKKPQGDSINASVMIRYRSKKYESTVREMTNNTWLINGETPFDHITPGQIGVLYNGEEVIGGGIIDSFENMKVQ